MPLKEAAKKVANKAAKKAAKKGAKQPGQEVRRAYEHLHRLHILQGQLSAESLDGVETLSRFAQNALGTNDAKSAANLLRAAEHLAFGSLASEDAEEGVSEELTQAAREEYDHLIERGDTRWAEHDPKPARELTGIYKMMRGAAKTAAKAKALHRSLEFARGAEALAHTKATILALKAPREANRPALR